MRQKLTFFSGCHVLHCHNKVLQTHQHCIVEGVVAMSMHPNLECPSILVQNVRHLLMMWLYLSTGLTCAYMYLSTPYDASNYSLLTFLQQLYNFNQISPPIFFWGKQIWNIKKCQNFRKNWPKLTVGTCMVLQGGEGMILACMCDFLLSTESTILHVTLIHKYFSCTQGLKSKLLWTNFKLLQNYDWLNQFWNQFFMCM